MHWLHYILLVVFSGITGWLVIRIVLFITFRPQNLVRVWGIKLQGFLPKNQPEIAKELGALVGREIISFPVIKQKASDPALFEKMKPEIEQHIDHFLRERLKDSFPMLAMFIGDKTINQLKSAFLQELESLFPAVMNSYLTNLESGIDPGSMIGEKLASFPIQPAAILLNKTARKLFTCLQWLGFGAGFLLGLVQVLIFLFLRQ
ncbi:MAG TPA: hypothetical protein DCQ97_10855 [Chitinophagaceae bacterium]|nr:hypothetical protein [Chitinophagaceae bacterium]